MPDGMTPLTSTVHRLILSPLIHAGLLHLAFNMLAFIPDATHIERFKGSVQFGYLLLQLMLCMDVLYVVVAYVASMYECFVITCWRWFLCFIYSIMFGLITILHTLHSIYTASSHFHTHCIPHNPYHNQCAWCGCEAELRGWF